MNKAVWVHATVEVISMPFLLALLAVSLWIGGCSAKTVQDESLIQDQQQYYYQQNVIRPNGSEPNVTPYGPPINATISSEYDRWIRPDAVSRYPGLE
ncbi:hypothetical protein [Brevibacillus panacihumi]|uniref:hypothetical protein n=1 Tax=Brevibacillus panacihumi TaxID=497735 RepID=UPI003D237896